MKKFISTLLISALLISSLTACNNENGNSSNGGASNSTPENTNGSSSGTDNSVPDGTSDSDNVDNSGLPFPDNRAGALAKAALATDSWPSMDLVDDPSIIEIMFSDEFNVDDFEESCFSMNIISAQLYRVIVIKPAEGSEDAVRAALDSYLNAVKTNPDIAFYPGQQAAADGAVTGQTNDGYMYLVVHENGETVANAIKAAG